jgi:ribosomal protein S8
MNDIITTLMTIKNSLIAKQSTCSIRPKHAPSCFRILRVLYEEGYILDYSYNKEFNIIHITHNYYKNVPTLSILKIYNKASFPVYLKYTDLATIHKFGIDSIILSTNKGIMPHYKALTLRLGGRAICYIR